MRVRKTKPWSNYGDNVQVYDVCFEVDKLDYIILKDGKDSEKYKNQHKKAVSLVNQYNAENKGTIALNLSSCRSIIQRKGEFLGEVTTFFQKAPLAKSEGL